MSKKTLTFVSHTHWDREWYQPFEEFRIRLVQLVDRLLNLLDTDPDYAYFMLDGQTIVLDDYLAVRPENEAKLKQYVQAGRIQIGPWYILPDEFLVSGESTVRNLLVGAQMCERFGDRMGVGNIPDPFGHISQMPQILRGFNIDAMVFWRGVSDARNEFTWRAPDGSEVLVIHQQHGYGNASGMPADEGGFIARTEQIIASLAPTATTPHLLAMNGSDHVEPMPELPRLIAAADAALPDVDILYGTLLQFIEAIRAADPELKTRVSEMRDGSKAPLLPGVLSTRMWIKQRNNACETLLTAWAEPMAAIAEIAGAPLELHRQSALVRQAWRYLLQNHPHDSICGCSTDQVHKEMDVRFDWVEQIGEKVTSACLGGLAAMVDTRDEDGHPAIVVFNPTTRPRSDVVSTKIPVPENTKGIELVSRNGQRIRSQVTERTSDVLWDMVLPVSEFTELTGNQIPHEIAGAGIQDLKLKTNGDVLHLEVLLGRGQPPNLANIERGAADIQHVMERGLTEQIHLLIHYGGIAECTFVASDVPGLGYCTYWVHPIDESLEEVEELESPVIENEYLRVEVAEDGTLALTDKAIGTVYTGLNRFVDVGDRGDEYNHCPVEHDVVVDGPQGTPLVRVAQSGPVGQKLEVSMTYQVPAALGETRFERSEIHVDLPITTRISLYPGVRRVDIETTIENRAFDHRLRAHFPVPAVVDTFDAEGHFDVLTRSLDLPHDTEDWVEQPVGTHPQRTWTEVSDGALGLMIANQGLPEIEVYRTEVGSEIALTLLRSVGWLSRADMPVRRGHAGPGLATPEAQCTGEHTFRYALVPHSGSCQGVFDQAHAFNAPLRAVATSSHDGTLPSSGSFVEVAPENLVVSAVKEAENGDGLVLRFWNTDTKQSDATVKYWKAPKRVARCNLAEEELEELAVGTDGSVFARARGREIVTLLARF
jgi:mannosylglycerate hydrolase